MKKKALTLSIVIPAYNEEDHLKACLDSIAAQTVMPAEVIVVDNNSTDKTGRIAKQYSFVKLLKEKKQHQVFAQARGFDQVRSGLIARIDADCILPKTWVDQAVSIMSGNPFAIAVTGGGEPYDVPLKKIGMWIFKTYHETMARVLAGQVMLWGSNMVFRTSSWPQLKRSMHFRPDIWEDYDMSFHMAELGELHYRDDFKVFCSFRAAHKPLSHQFRYQMRAVRTFYLHTSLLRTLCFSAAWATMLIFAPLPLIDKVLWKLRRA